MYCVASLWAHGLDCAALAGHKDIEKRLLDRFWPLLGEQKKFIPAPGHVRKAYLALVKKLDAHANLADVCEGTVKKNDRDHYLARPRVNGAPYGQAALMWICNALLSDVAVKTPATS